MTTAQSTRSQHIEPLVSSRSNDYARLSHLIRSTDLLNRRYTYYGFKIGLTGAAFIAGLVTLLLVGNSWWQLLVAVFLAIVLAQMAFLGHDAGHRQIFRTRWANEITGRVHANLLVGLSYDWWVDKHTRHHAHPNQEGADPDVAPGVLVYTSNDAVRVKGPATWLARHQAPLFFPLLLLEGLNLHFSSIRAIATRKQMTGRWFEMAFLTVRLIGYVVLLFVVMSPGKALVFLAVQQGAFGLYMGCSFAPNHKGMPTTQPGEKVDYLRRQVLTARNIRGGFWADFVFGGLNYQIEHHLFPTMPRPNLHRSQALIEEFCLANDISYSQTSVWRSYGEVYRHLHDVAEPLRLA